MATTLAKRVRELRERRRMTQVELASLSRVTTAYISRIESGERPNVGGDVLSRIAATLQTTTDYLLGQTPDPRPITQLLDVTGLDMHTAELVRRIEKLPQPYRQLAREQIASLVDTFEIALDNGLLQLSLPEDSEQPA